jgi:hypothetical protein
MSPYVAPRDAPPQKKWTVMVFMGAATIEGNAPLRDPALDDLAEMEFVGSGAALDVFVQVHGLKDVPQRSHVGKTGLADVPPGQQDPAGGGPSRSSSPGRSRRQVTIRTTAATTRCRCSGATPTTSLSAGR